MTLALALGLEATSSSHLCCGTRPWFCQRLRPPCTVGRPSHLLWPLARRSCLSALHSLPPNLQVPLVLAPGCWPVESPGEGLGLPPVDTDPEAQALRHRQASHVLWRWFQSELEDMLLQRHSGCWEL